MTQEKVIAELTEKLSQAPGFLYPIEGRLLMLSTGIIRAPAASASKAASPCIRT